MLSSEKNQSNEVEQIVDNLSAAIANTVKDALERVARLARGTGTHDESAAEAVRRASKRAEPEPAKQEPKPEPPKPRPTLRGKVEAALRAASLDQQQLAREVDASAGRISEMLKALRAENVVANVGTDVHPLWTWRIGNETSTAELIECVRRLITERPFTTRELSEVTGASYNRVGGAIVALQREPRTNIKDLGAGHAGRWFIIGEHVRDAHLEPKKPRKKNGT